MPILSPNEYILGLPDLLRRREKAWQAFYSSLGDGSSTVRMRALMGDWLVLDMKVRTMRMGEGHRRGVGFE